jgi:hypothetical protein
VLLDDAGAGVWQWHGREELVLPLAARGLVGRWTRSSITSALQYEGCVQERRPHVVTDTAQAHQSLDHAPYGSTDLAGRCQRTG